MPAGHRMRSFSSELRSLQGTRPLLEGHVHRRVSALPNVVVRDRCTVLRPLASEDDGRILGVRVRGDDAATEEDLHSDLVVDATGRGSPSPRWLLELGYRALEEERVGVDVRYLTRLYRRRLDQLDGQLGVIVTPNPPNTRVGGALAVEGDRWMVTLPFRRWLEAEVVRRVPEIHGRAAVRAVKWAQPLPLVRPPPSGRMASELPERAAGGVDICERW